jgi:hypothetical protein
MRGYSIHFETEVEGEPLTRTVGVLADNETVVVARRAAGSNVATPELEFPLADAVRHAEAILSGDRRAITQPGGMRIVCAAAALLARVANAAGGLQEVCTPATESREGLPDGIEPAGEPGDAAEPGEAGNS